MANGAKWNPFGGGAGQRPKRSGFIQYATPSVIPSDIPNRMGREEAAGKPTMQHTQSFNEQGFLDATAAYEDRKAIEAKRQEAMQALMAYGQEDLGPSAPSMQQFGPVSKSQFNLIDMMPEESIYDRQEKRKRKFFTEGLV